MREEKIREGISKKILLVTMLFTSMYANVDIKSIDIFSNKTFVNQKIDLTKTNVDLIGQVNLEDIRFTLNDTCQVIDSNVNQVSFKKDGLSKKIEDLKDSISNKNNIVKSLKSNISFLEEISISSKKKKKNLQEISKDIKKDKIYTHNNKKKNQKELRKDNENLNKLIKRRSNSKFTKLDYNISCNKSSKIIISYPINNLSRNSFYDINYDSKTKNINIKNSAFITQSSGVDFKKIDINLYTYNFIYQLRPNIFRPKYLDIYPDHPIAYAESQVMMDSVSLRKKTKSYSLKKTNISYIEDTTRSFFKASNVNLLSGKKTEVLFSKDEYKAKDSLQIDGYSKSQAFYKVDFKSKKLYGILNSKLYLDDIYIGRSHINEIKKDKKSAIFFGTNRFIDIKKELLKDMKEEPFFSLNKVKTQKLWKYIVTNNHSNTQNITLLEKVPISKHEDIKVKLIGETKEFKLEKNGKIYYNFILKPNENKIIEFGYEIEKPIKK